MRKIVLGTDTFSAKWLGVRMGESRGETYGLSGGIKEGFLEEKVIRAAC